MAELYATKTRLQDLERTVTLLTGRLRDVQWELRQVKHDSLTERLWRNLINSRPSNELMSAWCSKRVRPNMRMVEHGQSTHRY